MIGSIDQPPTGDGQRVGVTPVARLTFTVRTAAGHLACTRWGRRHLGRPTALLVHGTGFCASVWDAVATDLADDFDVVAFDRRGHGASTKPDDAYDFDDFADDITTLVDTLHLEAVYGIGHSAGGTDLLLSASRRPSAFTRLFVIEPTVMDPQEPTRDLESAPGPDPAALDRFQRRRTTFPSHRAAVEALTGRGIFDGWRPDLLDAYVTDGFEPHADGTLTLRCTPALEGAMLHRIAAAMNGTHQTRTFEYLSDIQCPVLVATTEHSNPRFKRMADLAHDLIDDTTVEHLLGVGHAVPQVAPERISTLARQFWDPDTARPSHASLGPSSTRSNA